MEATSDCTFIMTFLRLISHSNSKYSVKLYEVLSEKRIQVKLTVLDLHQASLRANIAPQMDTLVPLALFLFLVITVFLSLSSFFAFTILDICVRIHSQKCLLSK